MTTTWCAVLRRLFFRLLGLSPTQPGDPDEVESSEVDPVEHEGASEEFVAELRAMRNAEVSPDLISDIEQDLAWGLLWHEFERSMQDAIDEIFSPVLSELVRPRSFDEVRELVAA